MFPSPILRRLCASSISLIGLMGCGQLGLETIPVLDGDTGSFADESADPTGAASPGAADAQTDPSTDDASGGNRDDPDDGGSQGNQEEQEEQGGAADPTECTHHDFPILIHQATQDLSDPSLPYFQYQARDTDRVPFDELQITSYQGAPFYGPSTPGQYSLEGSNYSNCGLCVLLITSCNDDYQCNRVHFADEGTLEVVDFGDRTGQFRAVLRDAVIREVELNPSTYESTPVPGVDTWCVDEIDIQVDTYLYY